MKLLFVVENYVPHIGGVEIVFRNLCEGLAARGHDVTVITHQLPKTKRRETIGGVNVIRIPCADSRYLFTFAAIPTVLREAKHADLIHTTTYNGAFPAWVGARIRDKPVLITVHETWLGHWKEYTNFSRARAWMHEVLERLVYLPRFDRYIGVSQSTEKMLKTTFPKRADRITFVHNGFDPSDWKMPRKKEAAALRKNLRLQHRFVILGYGRPGTSKGFEYLLDAFPIVQKKIPDATLVLILSKDRQYAHKIDEFKERKIPSVIFLDPQPYNMLPAYVQMADCVVIPSITEGFGYTTLEAVAAGTPVVASDTTSIPEVISGAHVLVEPKDAHAIASGIILVNKKKHKRTPPKNFPWAKTILGYEREYHALLRGKR